jgi:transcriptional regulator with XRE-family HTH domain
MYIAQNLKYLRKKKGKSQEEMAQELGLNRSTYSGYENEVAQPSLELLLQLSKIEHIPLEVLLSKSLQELTNAELDAFQGAWKGEASGQNLRVLTTIECRLHRWLCRSKLLTRIAHLASAVSFQRP